MMEDRRNYTRLSIIDVPVLIYIENVEFEFEGFVHDISELGIGITLSPNTDIDKFNVDDDIKLVFCDEVYYASAPEKLVIMCECRIRHIETNNNLIFLGGYIQDEDFRKYYLKREMMNFKQVYNF